jgi:hypothetical protein
MKISCLEHVKNGPACKDKWNMISSDFKKIFDFMAGIGQNQDDWAMNVKKKQCSITL